MISNIYIYIILCLYIYIYIYVYVLIYIIYRYTCLCDIGISDDGCIWADPHLVVSVLYIYPFIWILLQSNYFCSECIFLTDIIKAYVFLFLFCSTSLENYSREQYRKLGNWKIKVQDIFKFSLVTVISLVFIIIRSSFS